jgi:predicted Zn finger-like uncharacterized protein
MKIECPSCSLTGKINEVELPEAGRVLQCPRCKEDFHVAKPKINGAGQHLMNICPSCQYSTFTDEMFAVCPKCGLKAGTHRGKPHPQKEKDLLKHQQDVLTRSHRNPDLVTGLDPESGLEKPAIPQTVRITGLVCIGVAALLLFYGVSGLVNYYGKDWQEALSEPFLEPVSKMGIFFRLGLIPWVITLYGGYLAVTATLFLSRRAGARKELARSAWIGLAVAVFHELFGLAEWIRISSSSPSITYILTGILNSLLWIVIWGAPPLVLVWFLNSEIFLRDLPDE